MIFEAFSVPTLYKSTQPDFTYPFQLFPTPLVSQLGVIKYCGWEPWGYCNSCKPLEEEKEVSEGRGEPI